MFKQTIAVTLFALSSTAVLADNRFAMLDADVSGTLSREEAARMPELAEAWDKLDVDGDGQLTLEEYSRFGTAMPEKEQAVEMKDRLSGK